MTESRSSWKWPSRDPESWRAYREAAHARGEDLGTKAWLPPRVADADNVFTHPWMLMLFAGEAPRRAGPEDLVAIHEMAARPRSSANVDFDKEIETGFKAWGNLSALGPILWVHADAALAAGDEGSAVADLEALLRLGDHFRGQNFLLSQVLGATMEARAMEMIQIGASGRGFSPESRQRLHAARRRRKIEEEIAATLRVERGIFLKGSENFPSRPPHSLRMRLSTLFYRPECVVAANNLFLCETLDPALSPSLSVSGWHDFKRRVNMIRWTAIPGCPIAIAGKGLLTFGKVVGGMLAQEYNTARVFERLHP